MDQDRLSKRCWIGLLATLAVIPLDASGGTVVEMLVMMPMLFALPCPAGGSSLPMSGAEVGLGGALGTDSAGRDQLLQIAGFTHWTFGRSRGVQTQILELMLAVLASVFVDRHNR